MKNGMIRIGMFEAYLERMLIRGIRAAYISYFTRTLQEAMQRLETICSFQKKKLQEKNFMKF